MAGGSKGAPAYRGGEGKRRAGVPATMGMLPHDAAYLASEGYDSRPKEIGGESTAIPAIETITNPLTFSLSHRNPKSGTQFVPKKTSRGKYFREMSKRLTKVFRKADVYQITDVLTTVGQAEEAKLLGDGSVRVSANRMGFCSYGDATFISLFGLGIVNVEAAEGVCS